MSTEKEEYEKAQKIVRKYEQKQKQAKENCVSFNLNYYILVRLKEEGYKHWLACKNKHTLKDSPYTLENLTSMADDDGFVQFQAHDFIHTFGETAYMGKAPLFDTNVRFYKNEIKDC